MALGNLEGFLYKFFLKDITKINYLIRHLLSIIDSWLIEKIVLPNQTILLLY